MSAIIGSGQNLYRTNASGVLNQTGTYTWMAWMKFSSASSWRGLLSFYADGSNYESVEANDSNQWFWGSSTGSTSGGSISTATWYHVAMVRDSAFSIKVYIDGTQVLTGGYGVTTMSPEMVLGDWTSAGSDQFLGRISYARAWQGTALDATQIAAEKDSTTPVVTTNLWGDWPLQSNGNDASGNGRNWSATGSVTYNTTDEPIAGGPVTLTPTATDTVTSGESTAAAVTGGSPANLAPTATDAVTVGESTAATGMTTTIALVGSASTNSRTAGTSMQLTVPTGTAAGHLMIAALWHELASPTITPPSGWTLLFQQNVSTRTANLAVYYREASGSEPANYTWTVPTSSECAAGLITLSAVNPGVPIYAVQENNSVTANNTAPAVTVNVANSWVLHVGGSMYGTTSTPPTNFSEIFDVRTGTATSNCMIAMSYRANPSTGTTGTQTATLAAADYNVGALLLVAPFVSAYSTTGSDSVTTGDSVSASVTGGVTTLSATGSDSITTGESVAADVGSAPTRQAVGSDAITASDSAAAATTALAATVTDSATLADSIFPDIIAGSGTLTDWNILIGDGYTDVSPKQLVRYNNRLYVVVPNCDSYPDFSANGLTQTLRVYRANSTGVPTGFTRMDSSNEPAAILNSSCAVDGSGVIHIAWTARSSLSLTRYLRYAQFSISGGTWGSVTTIASDLDFDDIGQGDQSISLALDADGKVHIVYLGTNGTGTLTNRRVYYRNNVGGSWSSATQIDTGVTYSGSYKAWHPNIAFAPDGKILVLWAVGQFNGGGDTSIYSRVYNGSWGSTVQVGTDTTLETGIDQSTSAVILPNGTFCTSSILHSATNSQKYIRFWYSTNGGASWTANHPTNQATHNPSLAYANGEVYILAHGTPLDATNHGDNVYYFKGSGTGAWSSWTQIVTSTRYDSSVNTRWAQFFFEHPSTLDIAYWDDSYPNVAYAGTSILALDAQATDSVAATDSVTVTFDALPALAATGTDSVTTGESTTRLVGLAATGADAISTGETQAVEIAAAPSLSATGASTATIADSADGGVSIGAAGASAATIGESAAASLPLIQAVVASTATTADFVGISQSTLLATATDSATLADSTARSLPISAAAADNATLADSVNLLLLLQRAASDAVVVADSTGRLLLSYRSATDAATAADSLSVAPLAVAATGSDALAAADSANAAIPTLFAAGSDAVVAADQPAPAPLAISGTISDAASAADSQVVAPLEIFTTTTDTAATGESQTLALPIAAQAVDAATVADGTAVTPLAVSATVTDASTLADTATVDLPLNARGNDAGAASDTASAVQALTLRAAAQSAAAVTDSGFTSIQTPGIFTIFTVDNVTVGESTQSVATLAATSASAATVADVAAPVAPYTDSRLATGSDAISVGESAAAVVQDATGFAPNASDSAALSDSAQAAVSGAQATGTDAVTASDAALAAIAAPGAFLALGSDAVVAADQPVGRIAIAASASDSGTAVDGTIVTQAAPLTATGSDATLLADSGTASIAAVGALNVSVSDAVTTGEGTQRVLAVAASGADAATVADSGQAAQTSGLAASANDAATLGETVAVDSGMLLSSSTDAVAAGETAAADIETLAASATDAITAGDTAGAATGTPADFEVSATDAITTADSGLAGDLFLAAIGVTAVVVADSTSSYASLDAAGSDAATLADSALTYYNDPHAFEASVTDAVSVADGALAQPPQLLAGVTDAASFADALTMLLNRPTAGQWTVSDLSRYFIQVDDAFYVYRMQVEDASNTRWTLTDAQV